MFYITEETFISQLFINYGCNDFGGIEIYWTSWVKVVSLGFSFGRVLYPC